MTIKRRNFLSVASAIGFSSTLGQRLCHALEQAEPSGAFQRCLVLWMEGGPSQLDTFDPKSLPGARKSIATRVPGLRFAESLPGLADRADELCVIRSVGSREGEHARATELLHTGFSPQPSFPRPSLGSMITHERKDPGFPRNVSLGGFGFGPAFLGSRHGPFVIEDLKDAKDQLRRVQRQSRSMSLLKQLNDGYTAGADSEALDYRNSAIDSVVSLLNTKFPEALNLETASNDDRQRYGDHTFGQRLLTARRLLELDVPFVEAQLGGWDTHVNNDPQTSRLCAAVERPWLALMDDLQSSGKWDDTLIVWMGEFGRTPRLNGRAGRDHFPEVTPVVMAGGNLGGRVVGETSDDGSRRVGVTHSVADLMATVLKLMGLDPNAEYTTDFGSPTTATDQGTPIHEIG